MESTQQTLRATRNQNNLTVNPKRFLMSVLFLERLGRMLTWRGHVVDYHGPTGWRFVAIVEPFC